MAEEFEKFINELNKKPIEEQIEKIKDIVSGLVIILEDFIKSYDIELNRLHNKIIDLETKQTSKLPKIDKLSISSPPPLPPPLHLHNNDQLETRMFGVMY